MGYSIFQFNKVKLQNLMFGENSINLNCGDLGLLNEIVDKYNSLPKYDVEQNGKLYVWINYEMLMNDFPILSLSIGTYRNVCRKLEKLGLIDKIDKAVKLQGGDCKKKTFFRPTELTLSLITTEADIQAQTKAEQGLQPVEEKVVVKDEEAKPKAKAKPKKKKSTKKDQAENIEVLERRISIEDTIGTNEGNETNSGEEKTDVEKIMEATNCTKKKAEEVLNYAITNKANNLVRYSIKAIEGNWNLNNHKVANNTEIKSFGNYTNNNSKRLKNRTFSAEEIRRAKELEDDLLGWY